MSEPLLNCRKRIDDIETRVQLLPWDKPGGCLLTGLVVSGTKVARARFRLQRGTWERLAPVVSAGCWTGRREGGSKQRKLRGAEYRCGAGGRTIL